MTTVIRQTRTLRGAPRALWFAVLALLLAVQSATGGSWAPERADGSTQTLRMVAAVPLAVQVRDAGKVVQAASRAVAAKVRTDGHDGDPVLPGQAFGLATARWDAERIFARRDTHPQVHNPADRYRARAPPQAG
jgi:hypothetical protein